MDFKGMSIVEIMNLAREDDNFANEFLSRATAACNSVVGSSEWQEFMKYFAADANELARLLVPLQDISNPLWTGRRGTKMETLTGGNTTIVPSTLCDRPDLLQQEAPVEGGAEDSADPDKK